jgi:cyclomaltodextrinase
MASVWLDNSSVVAKPATATASDSAEEAESGAGSRGARRAGQAVDQADSDAGRAGVPSWAADATWYQVFVSRFCNGDLANDLPETWAWSDDWTAQPPDAPPDRVELYFRRYGGDLQGLTDRLDYLAELGVNTLYLNPVFAASSEHKYDAADFRHVDDSFGVAGAREQLPAETDDPSTWTFNASDRLFLRFVRAAHDRGMRVVLDGVFNHVGRDFWAFQDVVRRGRDSAYANWFDIVDFGPPLRWNAWDGPNGNLVRFAREGDGLAAPVEAHLLAITRRWMDPDGDGDPSDGIDGWRLDAAEQVPSGFWRRWREQVKATNPEAIIVGELWGDAAEYLQGDQFDVVTDYRLARCIVRFCRPGGEGYSATRFAGQVQALLRQQEPARRQAMINLLDSHDTDRLASMMANQRRRYDRDNLPGEGAPPFDGGPPSEEAYRRVQLAALLQFTLPGAPMIYYGDEVGMYGGEDPYSRAPMWWADRAGDSPPGYRAELHEFYGRLCELRRNAPPLKRGGFQVLLADDARRVLGWERALGEERVLIVVNGKTEAQTIQMVVGGSGGGWRLVPLWDTPSAEGLADPASSEPDTVVVRIAGLQAVVLKLEDRVSLD